MPFGTTPVDNLNNPLSSVYVPGTNNSDLTAAQGGPVTTDGNNQKSAPVAMYLYDGYNVTQGAQADAANANTVMGQLKQIKANTASVTVGGGTVAATQSGAWSVAVNNFPATQPVSGTVAATQSGTWTVQPGNTANTTPWLATLNQGGNSATVTASNALKVDGSAVTQPVSGTFWQATQPVSGTVTANIGTTNGLALDTSVNGLLVAQASTTSGEKGPLVQGAVTTSAPSYTTAQTSPISLTTAGAIRVDGSGVTQPVSGTFWQTTQPISGTITANAGTGNFTVVQATGSNLHAVLDAGSATIGGVKLIDTGGTNVAAISASGAVKVDGSAVTQPVSGTFWQATQPVSGTFWQTTQPVSGTVSINAIPAGSALIGSVELVDSAGTNKATIDSSGNQVIKGNFVEQSGLSAPALNADLVASTDVSAFAWISLHITTIATGGTITFQASNDNFATQVESVNLARVSSSTTNSSTSSTTGIFTGACNFRYFRARQTAYTSGSTTGVFEEYTMSKAFNNLPVAATQAGTWTVQPGNTQNTTAWLTSDNLSQVGGTNIVTGGVSGLIGVGGPVASGSSNADNPVKIGAVFNSTQPTVTNAQIVDLQTTSRGELLVAVGTSGFAVTANAGTNLNTSALALDTSVNGTLLAQASTTSGQKGPLVQAAVTTAVPSYTTAQTNPLSMTTSGGLRTAGVAVEQASLTSGSLNADLVASVDVSVYKWFSIQINTSAFVGTLTIQGSNDNSNFIALQAYNLGGFLTSTITLTNQILNAAVVTRYLRIRMTAYTSGTAQGTLELYSSPAAWAYVQNTVSTSNATVPANTASNKVIKSSPGTLGTVAVTTLGTAGITLFDNATTNSGTPLLVIPASAPVGTIYPVNGTALAGITAAGVANCPALTVNFA
jgi:hypothetical protein